jgi:hypothetical protein
MRFQFRVYGDDRHSTICRAHTQSVVAVIGIRVFRQQDVIGITVFRFPLAGDTCTAPILLPAGCESVTPTEFLFVARLFFARVLLCQNDKLARVYRRFGLEEVAQEQPQRATVFVERRQQRVRYLILGLRILIEQVSQLVDPSLPLSSEAADRERLKAGVPIGPARMRHGGAFAATDSAARAPAQHVARRIGAPPDDGWRAREGRVVLAAFAPQPNPQRGAL